MNTGGMCVSVCVCVCVVQCVHVSVCGKWRGAGNTVPINWPFW